MSHPIGSWRGLPCNGPLTTPSSSITLLQEAHKSEQIQAKTKGISKQIGSDPFPVTPYLGLPFCTGSPTMMRAYIEKCCQKIFENSGEERACGPKMRPEHSIHWVRGSKNIHFQEQTEISFKILRISSTWLMTFLTPLAALKNKISVYLTRAGP